MNKLLEINRELRDIPDPQIRSREFFIKKIQVTYGYDRENAEKTYEYMKLQRAKLALGIACGTAAVLWARPIQRHAEKYSAIFKKPWMKAPIYSVAFLCAFYGGIQLPSRIFYKLTPSKNTGISHSAYTGNLDMVSKFRMFETFEPINPKGQIADYLTVYGTDPLTKTELIDNIALHALKEFDLANMFQIKRRGKDKDPIFWSFGKIHGLENIAFADECEIKATKGNPVRIQKLVNRYEGSPLMIDSYEHLVQETRNALNGYKEKVEKMTLNPSDRKKLLALPFYLSKRSEDPAPKRGQYEYQLFKELTGKEWETYDGVNFDPESKINEFEYEKFINPHLLKNDDLTSSDEFKKLIRVLNYFSRTEIEKHEQNKKAFQNLMPILRGLTPSEVEILVHKIKNSNQNISDSMTEEILNESVLRDVEEGLAKVSEEQNYLAKNRYRLERTVLDYGDKKRQPVDHRRLHEMLKNRPAFRAKILDEIQTHEEGRFNPQWEHGILSYISDGSVGAMKDLVRELGINSENIPFMNVGDLQKTRDSLLTQPSDHQFQFLLNALFSPIDMTDYENTFVGFDEIVGGMPNLDYSSLKPMFEEPYPTTHQLAALETPEAPYRNSRSRTHRDLQDLKAAEAEAAAEGDDEEEEEEEGDEEGEGEEGGEEAAAEEEADEEYEEEAEWPPKDRIEANEGEDKFFIRDETIRNKFNEIEIDSFMKLMNIRPTFSWEDQTGYHNRLGAHVYEDEAQELDPAFHLLGEVERKEMERREVEDFRRGTEVKFVLKEKRPISLNYRF
ncbi:UNKNOWN [Stylonychia lemnae]|uniref:Uncharacterized protein n=1 Tax=Stylonychia lemnae TaxID=5949 RepID=A0A078AXQ5_STYLE|nr:UNKNOWN [Stylonychia lemnae]|eukprot:CDW85583.1 UNKNOWN [Stylonychia lemnae]